MPVLELEVSNSGLPSFNPAVPRFDVFEFKLETLPTVYTLFPNCTPDPGKTRSSGRRILYLIYCSLARACNDVYLGILLPNPAPLAYFNREYLAIPLVAILKILRTGFAEQQVSSNMITKTFLAHPFGREGMDMALPGTLTRSCFRSLSKHLPEERPTSQRTLFHDDDKMRCSVEVCVPSAGGLLNSLISYPQVYPTRQEPEST